MGRLAKETGEVGGERIDQGNERLPGAVGQHVPVILLERTAARLPDYFIQACGDKILLAPAQIQPKLIEGQAPDLVEFLIGQRLQGILFDVDRAGWAIHSVRPRRHQPCPRSSRRARLLRSLLRQRPICFSSILPSP